jgi:tripartite-type tricarboxylate transporter receptor subunit TctC
MNLSVLQSACAAVVCLAACAGGAVAAFPDRPVRMVVPFAPGGASDFVGRIIQPAYASRLGQQVVIDNRSGAAGNLGVEVAARANADGHTVLLGNIGTMAINPVYYTKFQYRPLKDLAPVSQLVDVPGSLVVHPSLPVKTAKELAAYLRANPGKLNYGAPAPSSANTLETLMFLDMVKSSATQIAYKGGAGPATIGLLGNEVQFMFATFTSTLPFAKQGRLRMLTIVAPERSKAMPEVPTMREAGFDMTVGSWQGLLVPTGVPAPVIAQLHKVSQDVMRDPAVVSRLQENGVTIITSKDPGEFAAFIKAEIERFGKVIRDARIATE